MLTGSMNFYINKEPVPPVPLVPSGITEMLRLVNVHNSLQYYQELYEERAAIMEFDAGIEKHYAEATAFYEVIYLWLENEYTIGGGQEGFEKFILQNLDQAKKALSKIKGNK